MLTNTFDPSQAWNAVIYARMSSDRQNPRSPDQQISTIRETMTRHGFPWNIVKTYRDEGISGRLTQKRPGFMEMVADIESRSMEIHLVLVDTYERFARSADGAIIRARLTNRGILVLTADSGFLDPTTTSGRALSFVEEVRSTEDGRIKAHNVLRGKRDCARLKHWPGGPAPLGYRLQSVLVEINGVTAVDHHILVPHPELRIVPELAFELTNSAGLGIQRLANALKLDPRIPEAVKPLNMHTLNEMLSNEVYYGELVWGKHATGIVNDVRVLRDVPEKQWIRVPEFCTPLVSRDLWDTVQTQRLERRKASLAARRKSKKNPVDTAPGIALRYLLSGLVYCDSCGKRMTASSTKAYEKKSGEKDRYASYVCLGGLAGACTNTRRVRERWLREQVIDLVNRRLFFDSPRVTSEQPAEQNEKSIGAVSSIVRPVSTDDVLNNPRFREFASMVHDELKRLNASSGDNQGRIAQLREEQDRLDNQCNGWIQSLGIASLSPELRAELQSQFSNAKARIQSILNDIAQMSSYADRLDLAVCPEVIADRLAHLATLLAGENISATNIALSYHIDRIRCSADGRVVVRTCKLGALAGDLDLVPRTLSTQTDGPPADGKIVRNRQRSRLDVQAAIGEEDAAADANAFAGNPNRFAGLSEEWFTEDVFQVPKKRMTWPEAHGLEVAQYRLATGATEKITAVHFGHSILTIRSALRYARDTHGIDAMGKHVSRHTRPNWARDNAEIVHRYMQDGAKTLKEAAAAFNKCVPTISNALKYAASQATPSRSLAESSPQSAEISPSL